MRNPSAMVSKPFDFILNWIVNNVSTKKEIGEIIKKSGKNKNPRGLDEWYKKWSVLGTPNKDYYRVFSQYIGENIDLVPDNISHNYIVPILNPKRHISTYADKNLFDRFISTNGKVNVTPPTLLRCINGTYYSSDYCLLPQNLDIKDLIKDEESIIVKPSIDASSGNGVLFFEHKNNQWIESSHKLNFSFQDIEKNIGNNFIIQKKMEQSPFMSHLCKSSVNTIRIAVYRSVRNNKSHVLRSTIRIGKEGSLVDNAHAGGMFIGVDDKGSLASYCCNQYGEKVDTFNGINFKDNNFIVPNYDKVKQLAIEVSESIPHLRLLALDIMLDKNNNPILIEYNVKAFAPWLFQFSSGTAFREFTDEIIDYCAKHKEEATRLFISF